MSVEEGDALDLKITINLRKDQEVAGSLAVNVGNIQILLLHRVMRLVQVGMNAFAGNSKKMSHFSKLFLMPLEVGKVSSLLISAFHWILGPSMKVLLSDEKYIDMKISIDGPTLLVPELKENPQLFTLYLGNIIIDM